MRPARLVAAVALLIVAAPIQPHGGGLDANGCHTNRKTGDYHCHRSSYTPPPPQQPTYTQPVYKPPPPSTAPSLMSAPAAPPITKYSAIDPVGIPGRVVGIIDGDTVDVLLFGNQQERVRLQFIDAPEEGQPYGDRAKLSLANLVYEKPVRVIEAGRDLSDRIIGRVTLMDSGRDVGEQMVRDGLAWWYKPGAPNASIIAAENAARGATKGLWADSGAIAPWEWRKQTRP